MCAKRGGKHEFARTGADLSLHSNWTARASKREGLPPKRLPKQLPLHSHLAAEAATSAERAAVSAADGQEAPPPLVAIRCGGWFEDCGGGCVDGAQPWLLLCGVRAMESRKGQTWDSWGTKRIRRSRRPGTCRRYGFPQVQRPGVRVQPDWTDWLPRCSGVSSSTSQSTQPIMMWLLDVAILPFASWIMALWILWCK